MLSQLNLCLKLYTDYLVFTSVKSNLRIKIIKQSNFKIIQIRSKIKVKQTPYNFKRYQ